MQSTVKTTFLLAALLVAVIVSARMKTKPVLNNHVNSKTMKEYILIIRLPLAYSPEQAAEVRPQWNALTDQWKANGVFVTSFVFPSEGYVVSGESKMPTKEYVVSGNTKVVSSIVIHAESFEQAIEFAKMCPILKQDGTVEVREVGVTPPNIPVSPAKK